MCVCVSYFHVQVDLFSKNLLLVPIHLEVHWCLVTADSVKKKICIYDSQGNAIQKVARVTADFMSFFVTLIHVLSCFYFTLLELG